MIDALSVGERSVRLAEAEDLIFSASVDEDSRSMMVTALLMRTYPAIPRRAIAYALDRRGGFLLGELKRYAGLPDVVAEGWADRFIAMKERSIDFALLANPALEAEDVWRLYARHIRFERNSWNGRLDLATAAWDHSSFGNACAGRSDVVFDFVRLRLRDVLEGLVGAWKTNGQAPPTAFAEALLAAMAEHPEELGGARTPLVPSSSMRWATARAGSWPGSTSTIGATSIRSSSSRRSHVSGRSGAPTGRLWRCFWSTRASRHAGSFWSGRRSSRGWMTPAAGCTPRSSCRA
ncbi:MAG TPA: hypothetical protein VF006_28535 [Longimicrobium sp.]